MLRDDSHHATVKTIWPSIFPKGTTGIIIGCEFIPGTSTRIYLVQTTEDILGLVRGPKTEWYLERDLVNA